MCNIMVKPGFDLAIVTLIFNIRQGYILETNSDQRSCAYKLLNNFKMFDIPSIQ